MIRKQHIALVVLTIISLNLSAQHAEIRDTMMTLKTYPFSDPDPIPKMGVIYPYYLYEGYSHEGAPQDWKMVELENDYIKVFVTPEMGGKVWGAVEKSTGKEFIYFNHVVRFIDVGRRGPWTSGGIEYNFGIIGHDPMTATPVDYLIRNHDDGSVTCYVSSFDLPSGTRRTVEIGLPKDKAYFTLRMVWDNPNMLEESYYQWTNASVKTAGNLEYVFPGDSYIGHLGEPYGWPVQEEGHEISFYEKNDFGEMKSYHIFGAVSDFFGGYWHDDDFGFAHHVPYDEKPGTKIWIWGLSPKGMIWEKLATDSDGQYTEIQSGRSLNQAGFGIGSPFDFRGFAPGSTDEWTEYWFPVKGTKGLKYAIPEGSVNVTQEEGKIHLWFCPNIQAEGKLEVRNDTETIFSKEVQTTPLVTINESFDYPNNPNKLSVWFNNKLIFDADREKYLVDRPIGSPKEFDLNTAYGQYVIGSQSEHRRSYKSAETAYRSCLEKNPWFVPALNGMASVLYRKMDYKSANEFALKSLSVNTYDPAANMAFGNTELALGDTSSAIDGFSLASLSVTYRAAAYNGLSAIFMNKCDYERALSYANKSQNYNKLGSEAAQLKIISLRLLKRENQFEEELNNLDAVDPLNHFIRFERYLSNPTADNELAVKELITNEFQHETYLTYALWYYKLGRIFDAINVLSLSSDQPMVHLWKGYLNHLINKPRIAADELGKAVAGNPELVLPFRRETVKPLQWALEQNSNWKMKYYLGLIYLHAGDAKQCEELWLACGNEPDFYPFYLSRVSLFESLEDQMRNLSIYDAVETATAADTDESSKEMVLNDIQRAQLFGGNEWRVGMFASEFYLKRGEIEEALNICKKHFKRDPSNYYIGTKYASLLNENKQYKEAVELLKNLQVLKGEATGPARGIWRDANIGLALDYIQKKRFKTALKHTEMSKQYLWNLVMARPYVTDERLEDFIASFCLEKLGRMKESSIKKSNTSAQVKMNGHIPNTTDDFLSAWILRSDGEEELASEVIEKLGKNNTSEMMNWCIAVFNDDTENLPGIFDDPSRMNSNMTIFSKMYDLGLFMK